MDIPVDTVAVTGLGVTVASLALRAAFEIRKALKEAEREDDRKEEDKHGETETGCDL